MQKYRVMANVLGGHPYETIESDDPWYRQFVPPGWLEEVTEEDGHERSEPESGPGVSHGEGVDAGSHPGTKRGPKAVSG